MGYSYFVKKLILAPLIIMGLLFLTSCSSSSKPINEPQAKTECDIASEKSIELMDKASEVMNTEGRDAAKGSYLYWAFFTLEKSECFSPEVVAAAKTMISLYQK